MGTETFCSSFTPGYSYCVEIPLYKCFVGLFCRSISTKYFVEVLFYFKG